MKFIQLLMLFILLLFGLCVRRLLPVDRVYDKQEEQDFKTETKEAAELLLGTNGGERRVPVITG